MKFAKLVLALAFVPALSFADYRVGPETKAGLPKFFCTSYSVQKPAEVNVAFQKLEVDENINNTNLQEEVTFFSNKDVTRTVAPSKRVAGWAADKYLCYSTAKNV